MSWASLLFRRGASADTFTDLKLRVTRFGHLLDLYGSFQERIEDAGDKQGGGYVLDRQFVVTLVEQVAELTEAAVFDLNVLTAQKHVAFFEVAERLVADLRKLAAERPRPSLDGAAGPRAADAPAAPALAERR